MFPIRYSQTHSPVLRLYGAAISTVGAGLLLVGLAGCQPANDSKSAVDADADTNVLNTQSAQPSQNAENTDKVIDNTQDTVIESGDDRTPFPTAEDGTNMGATLIGDYQGILPCAQCDGIAVELNLLADGSVNKTSRKQGKDAKAQVFRGHYQQNNNVIGVHLDNGNDEYYRIHNNQLVLLNADKKENTGPLASQYVLSRE